MSLLLNVQKHNNALYLVVMIFANITELQHSKAVVVTDIKITKCKNGSNRWQLSVSAEVIKGVSCNKVYILPEPVTKQATLVTYLPEGLDDFFEKGEVINLSNMYMRQENSYYVMRPK